jgi:transposase
VAQFKLCYSRAFMLRTYLLQTHEMPFDVHNHALAALGGVLRRGIYDNIKTAVGRVRRGKAREDNARFRAMASHFLFDPGFCSPAVGWEKGQYSLFVAHRITIIAAVKVISGPFLRLIIL